ncbi:hypothetical protein C8J56DRAFT_1103111 [Mycena floridula]|nr:hypothetical protein C8J56DRAFT_1103111 [Mycena floridula]
MNPLKFTPSPPGTLAPPHPWSTPSKDVGRWSDAGWVEWLRLHPHPYTINHGHIHDEAFQLDQQAQNFLQLFKDYRTGVDVFTSDRINMFLTHVQYHFTTDHIRLDQMFKTTAKFEEQKYALYLESLKLGIAPPVRVDTLPAGPRVYSRAEPPSGFRHLLNPCPVCRQREVADSFPDRDQWGNSRGGKCWVELAYSGRTDMEVDQPRAALSDAMTSSPSMTALAWDGRWRCREDATAER